MERYRPRSSTTGRPKALDFGIVGGGESRRGRHLAGLGGQKGGTLVHHQLVGSLPYDLLLVSIGAVPTAEFIVVLLKKNAVDRAYYKICLQKLEGNRFGELRQPYSYRLFRIEFYVGVSIFA